MPKDPKEGLEAYFGHPIDPKTEVLIAYVRVTFPDLLIIDPEPPTDAEQEELPY